MLKRLVGSMLEVGAPIPFDCFDSQGRALLKTGEVVTQMQMDALLLRGLYVETVASIEEVKAGPLKIVVVDDNQSMRNVLSALFSSQGYAVVATLGDAWPRLSLNSRRILSASIRTCRARLDLNY